MASLLYRLGRFSFRRRRLVLLLWLAVLGAVLAGAARLSGPTYNTRRRHSWCRDQFPSTYEILYPATLPSVA